MSNHLSPSLLQEVPMLHLPLMLLLAHLALPAKSVQPPVRSWRSPYLSWEQVDHSYASGLERTVEGKIHQIHWTRLMGKDSVLYLVLDQGKPGLVVLVAPASFLSAQRALLYHGLPVVCTGSQQRMGGRDVMTAREIKVGERILTLRDKGGKAQWIAKGSGSSPPSPKPGK
jgi:hypothetical protein